MSDNWNMHPEQEDVLEPTTAVQEPNVEEPIVKESVVMETPTEAEMPTAQTVVPPAVVSSQDVSGVLADTAEREAPVTPSEPYAWTPTSETYAWTTSSEQPEQPVPTAQPHEPYVAPTPQNTTSNAHTQPANNAEYTPTSIYSANYTTPPKKKSVSGDRVAIAVLSVVCCLALIASGVFGFIAFGGSQNNGLTSGGDRKDNVLNNHEDNTPILQITDTEKYEEGGLSTSSIVQKNLDATVVLTMYQQGYTGGYFGFGGSTGGLTQAGAASGIVMSEDGWIITNSHCVFDEENQREYAKIDVTLYNGEVYEAEIKGYDPTTDLAVIKIDKTGLTPAEFGDSSALSLGDRVVTLGNSGGLEWSVSEGVLSGQARSVYEDTGYAIKCLQVDAIINPGSSGGPLLNEYGQVVGVNSAKIVLSGYEGLGFSIPINEANAVIDDLVKYGRVTGRVSLGINGKTSSSLGYEGFQIYEIERNSALKGSGAQEGDVITHVDGVRVMNYSSMREELAKHNVGDIVTLTLIRFNIQEREVDEFDIKVQLKEAD